MTISSVGKHKLNKLLLYPFDCNYVIRFVKEFKFSGSALHGGRNERKAHCHREVAVQVEAPTWSAQEEFDRLLGGGVSGKERYVEWKRICMYEDEIEDK